jgi:hypothetical protein
MNASRAKLAPIFAAIAVLAIPAGAAAAPYVPPGNSAATQYTEAVPTAGGPKATNNSKHRQGSTPDKVLGKGNAARLDAKGQVGREAAEVAAATAPAPSGVETGSGGGSQGNGAAGTDDSHAQAGADSPNRQSDGATQATDGGPDGSSALGEVASQVTGSSSSGGIGLLLPLAILAAVAGAIAYLVRQRRRPAS